MRRLLASIALAWACSNPVHAQVSIGVAVPGLSIGIQLPQYPELVPVPGYPVYYAPGLSMNFFFYDGRYWVYQGNNWYMSAWYNGPWARVAPLYVPVYVLRVPVRYYRVPPPYFRPWRPDRPPRWGEHWGDDWQRQRKGWDTWDHRAVPPRAPLPVYQRQYAGERYPHQVERQQALNEQNYRYRPQDPVLRQQARVEPVRGGAPDRDDRTDRTDRSDGSDKSDKADRDSRDDRDPQPQPRDSSTQQTTRPAPATPQRPPAQPGPPSRESQARPPGQADMPEARAASPESRPQRPPQGKGHEKGNDKSNERGQGGKPQ